MNADSDKKLLMLGVDAGDLEFIRASLDRLPNFRRFLDGGACAELDTTSRLLTGSVWPTFYTGTHPGEHGVYHHLQWDPSAMRIRRVSADWLYCEPFWYELARQGARVAVLDVPMTFPSRLPSGVEIINWGSHDQLGPFHANHAATARGIRERFGAHPMGPEIPVQKTATQIARIRRDLVAGAARKGELIRHLLQSTDWDFFLAVFGECHRGGHILWPDTSPDTPVSQDDLLDVYAAVDQAIGTLLESIDVTATSVVLFSLHGMQPNQSQEHFMPGIMQRANSRFAHAGDSTAPAPRGQRSLMRTLRDRLPARLQNAVARAVPVAVRDWVVSRATSGGYDWSSTPGFALLADYNGYLRFNLAGREAQGCLQTDSETHRRYAEWLRQCLCDVRVTATGRPLVSDLVTPDRVYPGARASLLPDLIVTWPDSLPATDIESPQLGRINAHLETGRGGNHRHQGFVAALGSDAAHWQSAAHILDLAPLARRCFAVP